MMKCKQSNKGKAYLIIGVLILAVFLLWSLFLEMFARHDMKESFRAYQKPNNEFLLGTNDLGYDIFSELIYAAGTTLLVGVTAALISIVIGALVGLFAGYSDGILGDLLNGLIHVFLLIPMLPLIVICSAFLGQNLKNIIIIIAVLGWCATARAVRARVRQLKESSFVESLIILGIPRRQIVFKHILPNVTEVISARYILSVASCMLTESSVSFMGLGDPMAVTWGGMINIAFKRGGFVRGMVYWYLLPGLCITFCSLAFFLLNQYFTTRSNKANVSYLD